MKNNLDGCHLVLQRSAPAGRLKRDFISIKLRDGRDLELHTPQGYRMSPIELPHVIPDDFLRASFVKQNAPQGAYGNGGVDYP